MTNSRFKACGQLFCANHSDWNFEELPLLGTLAVVGADGGEMCAGGQT